MLWQQAITTCELMAVSTRLYIYIHTHIHTSLFFFWLHTYSQKDILEKFKSAKKSLCISSFVSQ
jgi:hypothetical protein